MTRSSALKGVIPEMLAIHPEKLTVLIAPELEATDCAELAGKEIAVPSDERLRPSEAALEDHLRGSSVRVVGKVEFPN